MRVNTPEARYPEKCEACGQVIEHTSETPFEAGDLLIRPGFRSVERRGKRVRLTEQQYRILAFIVKRGSARKEAIYQEVFESLVGDGPDPKIVEVQVCKLRGRLGEVGAGGVIKTIWGRGYAFDPTNESPARTTAAMRKQVAAERAAA